MNAPKVVQTLGNIPAVRAVFYTDNKKPEMKLESDWRCSYLRYKTDKESNTLRSSMAVGVRKIARSQVSAEAYEVLLAETQDGLLKRCADGEISIEDCESGDFLSRDVLDSSRAGGKRVSAADVGKWFEAEAETILMDSITAKYPKWDADKVVALIGQYRQSFQELTKYSLPQSKQISAMLDRAYAAICKDQEEISEMCEYVGERLKKLAERHSNSETLLEAI